MAMGGRRTHLAATAVLLGLSCAGSLGAGVGWCRSECSSLRLGIAATAPRCRLQGAPIARRQHATDDPHDLRGYAAALCWLTSFSFRDDQDARAVNRRRLGAAVCGMRRGQARQLWSVCEAAPSGPLRPATSGVSC